MAAGVAVAAALVLDGKAAGDLVHAAGLAGWLLPWRARRWPATLEQQLRRLLLCVRVFCWCCACVWCVERAVVSVLPPDVYNIYTLC
jgi:hypothetical protein